MKTYKFKIEIRKAEKEILSIANFEYKKNKINLLLGESGIGKTLLSKAIYGILDTSKFQIKINEQTYSQYIKNHTVLQMKNDGFFVFQEPSSHLNPLIKIGTQLKEGDLGTGKNEHNILKALWKNSDENKYISLLKVYPKPFRPSGGEKQRFLLVMALKKIDKFLQSESNNIPIFIFDEPTGSLDDQLRNWFLDLLFKKYLEKPFTILFITHDYSIISQVANNYQKLKENLYYHELVSHNNKLEQINFNETEYIDWIKKTEKTIKSLHDNESNCIFVFKNNIEIFSKKLAFFNYNNKKTDLKIHKNEIVYLKAPSGMGKTTIAKIILGLLKANSFEFLINKKRYNSKTSAKYWKKNLWGKLITMTFQHADEALNLNSSVKQTLLNIPRKKRPKSEDLLSKLNMVFENNIDKNFLNKKIRHLSGGQKQRINLLRAFLLETPLMILDEPLNGLDFFSIKKIVELIQQRAHTGTGILIISHNEEIIQSFINEQSIYYLKSI